LQRLNLILFLLLYPIYIFGQKTYKFKYKGHLTSHRSTLITQLKDTILETGKCYLSVTVLDKKGEVIPFAHVVIHSATDYTTLRADTNGFVKALLNPGMFSISVYAYQFTALELNSIELKKNTMIQIKTSLGRANGISIIVINSKRKLRKSEIRRIIDEYSNGIRGNQLIINGTCRITMEI
jgi:hypothetical protein